MVSADPAMISSAWYVVLPGVGSARSAMTHLTDTGAAQALRERVEVHRPVLGICLGLQLALTWSAEDGGVEGLDIVPGRVVRLVEERVPRLGWSLVEPWDEVYYFAHSYAAVTPDSVASAEGVVAAVARGTFLGVQFHPEKSGPAGLAFLDRCLSLA